MRVTWARGWGETGPAALQAALSRGGLEEASEMLPVTTGVWPGWLKEMVNGAVRRGREAVR